MTKEEHSWIGRTLGHYKIVDQIGAGGMGEVYLAQDARLHRKVAVKVLPVDLTADRERASRFEQEATAASALNHPNIIVIYEIGETGDGVLFMASEYIQGKTLRDRLRSGNLDLIETLDIAIQITGALSAAHESGIIHRDIKPENVMIRPDGYVKVLDFGLAKLVEAKLAAESEASTIVRHDTAPGLILGTVRYMSPEQARGNPVDERTDIFSLGVVLYEMIAGRAPFDGQSNTDVLAAILDKEPPSLSRFVPEIPDELPRIVNKMLRKKTDERYQSMRDLLIDLKEARNEIQFEARLRSKEISTHHQPTEVIENVATGAPALAVTGDDGRQMSTVGSGTVRTGRSKYLPVAVFGVAIVLFAAGIWYFAFGRRSQVVIAVQKVTQLTSWQGLDDFPSMSPDGNSVAYCSDHNGTFEIYVKSLTPGAREVQLTNDGGQNFEPAFSHDGKHIAYYSKLHGGIWVIPSSGGDVKQLTDIGSHPAWSPDDTQIVYQSNSITDLGAWARNSLPPSTLWIVSANGGDPHRLTEPGDPEGGHGSPAWSPDGKRIAFEVNGFTSSSVWTISSDGGQPKPVMAKSEVAAKVATGAGGYAPTYAPDGQSIFYHTESLMQVRIDPSTGDTIGEPVPISSVVQQPSVIRRVSFSADGKKVAYSILRRTESISSTSLRAGSGEPSGTPQPIVSNATGRNNFPAFSPDGKRLAYGTCNIGGSGCDIWLANSDGSNQTQLTTSEKSELMPSWFSSGEQVAFTTNRTGHNTLWAIDVNTRRESMLLDLKTDVDYFRVSPDGKSVIYNGTKDGAINVWKASLDGGEPKQLTFDDEMMAFPTWAPDGRFIAFQVKRGDVTNIMIMSGDGGAPEQLTFDKGQDWIYSWSPDGDKILFAGQRDGYWNVWWVSRSTKKEQQLTDYKKLNSFVRYPAWSPKGDQVAYEYSETTGNIWVGDLK